jgi:putative endonuclease
MKYPGISSTKTITFQLLSIYCNNYSTMDKQYYIYILTNIGNTVLYTGVTNDLGRRIMEHKEGVVKGFTKRYNLCKLVYYEITESVESAIIQEKRIKKLLRKQKEALINSFNKEWRDLYSEL